MNAKRKRSELSMKVILQLKMHQVFLYGSSTGATLSVNCGFFEGRESPLGLVVVSQLVMVDW